MRLCNVFIEHTLTRGACKLKYFLGPSLFEEFHQNAISNTSDASSDECTSSEAKSHWHRSPHHFNNKTVFWLILIISDVKQVEEMMFVSESAGPAQLGEERETRGRSWSWVSGAVVEQ